MSILIYLTNQENITGLQYFSEFFKELDGQYNNNKVVVVESEFDFQFLKEKKNNLNIHKIVNLYKTDKNIKSSTSQNQFPISHLLKIDPRINKKKLIDNFLASFEHRLIDLINKYKVKHVCYLSPSGVFRSLGLFHSYHLIKKLPIKIFFPFTTPVKGRFMIYDNIYFRSESFNENNESVLNENEKFDKTLLDHYFSSYERFKTDHLRFMIERREESSSLLPKNISFKFFLKKILNILIYGFKKKQNSNPINKPYALILLTKNNQWYNSYADQDLLNIPKLVYSVHKSLPSNYSLVLKSHPHLKNDDVLIRIASNLKNCKIYFDEFSTDKLADSADVIISFGSSAGVESLMKFKKVIEVGKNPAYYNLNNPPVFKARTISKIKDVLNHCIEKPQKNKEIFSYFHSMLTNSFSITSNEEISMERSNYTYRKIARELMLKIEQSD